VHNLTFSELPFLGSEWHDSILYNASIVVGVSIWVSFRLVVKIVITHYCLIGSGPSCHTVEGVANEKASKKMVKLSPELIASSAQFFNPIKERELDLRGNKIAIVENLGTTRDAFDVIDFSDNEISRLENFPILKRLHTLLVNNNRVNYIDEKLGEKNLQNLETLILTNNYFRELDELNGLKTFKKLKSLSLLDNIVIKKDNYRLYCIFLVPSLKHLDFVKVKKVERERSQHVFGTLEKPTEEALKILGKTQAAVSNGSTPGKPMEADKLALSPEEIQKIKLAIVNAKTLQEIEYYKESLRQGRLPKELK